MGCVFGIQKLNWFGIPSSKEYLELDSLNAKRRESMSGSPSPSERAMEALERKELTRRLSRSSVEFAFDNFIHTSDLFKSSNHLGLINRILQKRICDANTVLFAAMDPIMDEGYIVASGSFEINGMNCGSGHVASPGDTIGDVSLLNNTRPYYSAIAKEQSLLLVLKRKNLRTERHRDWIKLIKKRMTETCTRLVLEKLRIKAEFIAVDDDRLEIVASLCTVHVLKAGDRLYSKGEPDDSFYVLSNGKLVETMKTSKGIGIAVVRYRSWSDKGSTFGNITPSKSGAHSTTQTAIVDSMVIKLSGSKYSEVAKVAPELIKQFKEMAKQNEELTSILERVPFTRSLEAKAFKALQTVFQPVDFDSGETIIKKDQRLATLYLLSFGSVDILTEQGIINVSEPGSYFGEISVVVDVKATTTVLAGSNGARCFFCRATDFALAFEGLEALYNEVAIRILGKDCPISFVLNHQKSRKAFLEHCEKEYAAENIDFYLAAEEIESIGKNPIPNDVLKALKFDIQTIHADQKQLLKAKSEMIVDRFIQPDGISAINMPSDMREQIIDAINNHEYSYDLFKQAKEAVITLLEHDSYLRFRESKMFEELFISLAGYSPNSNLKQIICTHWLRSVEERKDSDSDIEFTLPQPKTAEIQLQ